MQKRENEVLKRLRKKPGAFRQFERLEEKWQRRFMEYCTGKKTLPITYDPFFKRIFHPDIHPDRLSRLLSSILGRKVKVVLVLPAEEHMLDGDALLIMDILVELDDGALANVEIQKVPYLFPGERMSCYSSDLVLRQYSRVKGEKGAKFRYNDMKPVYTIVLFEKSLAEFHRQPGTYIHHGETVFDTGLKLKLLQEYWLIALDVFREIPYPKERSEQTAWLSLLATEDVEDTRKLMEEYPWLEEIYQDMEEYIHKPEEVLNMFSEALKIMDRNTVQYMIEQLQDQLAQKDKQMQEQKEQMQEQKEQMQKQMAKMQKLLEENHINCQ